MKMIKEYINKFGENIKVNNEGRFIKGYKHNQLRKDSISLFNQKWHKSNRNTEEYLLRNKRIRLSKVGVQRVDLIGNKFSVGNKPNITSFRKGISPWNKGIKAPAISKGQKGKLVSDLTKLKQSKVRKEKIASGLIIIPSGERSHSWLGGKSFEPYTKEFNKHFKYLVRLRDNFCCINCGLSEQKSLVIRSRRLTVHHIDYNKLNSCLQNCCTLCTTCNNKANFNRDYWINYFQLLLSNKYNYQYNLEKEIIG